MVSNFRQAMMQKIRLISCQQTLLGGALLTTLVIQSGCSAENAPKATPTLVLSECRVAGMDSTVNALPCPCLKTARPKQGVRLI